MILFTALFSRRFAGNLTKPLRMLEEGARQIERKNLNFEISYAADNELGQLCRAFSSMQEELKKFSVPSMEDGAGADRDGRSAGP